MNKLKIIFYLCKKYFKGLALFAGHADIFLSLKKNFAGRSARCDRRVRGMGVLARSTPDPRSGSSLPASPHPRSLMGCGAVGRLVGWLVGSIGFFLWGFSLSGGSPASRWGFGLFWAVLGAIFPRFWGVFCPLSCKRLTSLRFDGSAPYMRHHPNQ